MEGERTARGPQEEEKMSPAVGAWWPTARADMTQRCPHTGQQQTLELRTELLISTYLSPQRRLEISWRADLSDPAGEDLLPEDQDEESDGLMEEEAEGVSRD